MIDATNELPVRMIKWGCTLEKKSNGYTVKFVLKNEQRNYRGFIYIKESYTPDCEVSLHDLYANFFYETGLQRIKNT